MKKLTHSLLPAAAIVLSFTSLQAFAGAAVSDTIVINDPYVRAVPPGQPNSAAFMQIENKSDANHAVVNATSDVSKVVELHTHTHEGGMMKMRRIEKITIPAQSSATLKPGGLHIMLIGLHHDLKPDQQVSLTLEFEDGSTTSINAPVRKIMMQGGMKH